MRDMGPTLKKLDNLESKIQSLLNERDKFRLEAKNERELSESIVAEREKLYLQVEEMQKTLEWYADEENYDLEADEYYIATKLDRGERARKTLKGVETK